MEFILFAVITAAVLGTLVVFLHKHQVSETHVSADKGAPLPPLGQESLDATRDLAEAATPESGIPVADIQGSDNDDVPEDDDPLAMLIQNQTAPTRSANDSNDSPSFGAEKTIPGEARSHNTEVVPLADSEPEQSAAQELNVSETQSATSSKSADEASWSDQVASLKKAGKLETALQICEDNYPLMSAFQQASLIYRAKIKELIREDQPTDQELMNLYRVAALASFLHDPVNGLPNLSSLTLKALDLKEIMTLDMPYTALGYTQLKLLKKTDILQLKSLWGEPNAHAKPREYHRDAWESLTANVQEKLF